MITKEQYENHDCHLSAEDSCETCEQWFWENQAKHSEDYAGLENSLSAKVERWARELEKVTEENKWSGFCFNKHNNCEEDYCRCK